MEVSGWHPIAASQDLPFRHVHHGQLFGREFAVWRADDGYVNVWENRCLHRGVRLSIGINDGRELKCQYHGWRYANRTAGCTYIPAHPADAPARTITNRTYAAAERYGLVWSSVDGVGAVPEIAALEGAGTLALRAIPVNASARLAMAHLEGFEPILKPDDALPAPVLVERASLRLVFRDSGAEGGSAVIFVQPVDTGRCVIRAVLDRDPGGRNRLALLRANNERLSKLRDAIEADAARGPLHAETEQVFEPLPEELAELPPLAAPGRKAAITVTAARKWQAASGIVGLELRPVSGLLPTFQPGAHVDLHLPNGLVRQYSITNAPGETGSYIIGVKLESPSRGGSSCVHDAVREGDLLAISEPRNNFPLRRDATKTLFIAGGIGITPLLSMAQALHHMGLPYDFHLFAQTPEAVPFEDRLAALGASTTRHVSLSPSETLSRIRELLAGYHHGRQVYLCGPGPMLEAARAVAAEQGWPDAAVHFEYFRNTREIDDSSSFDVALARSAMTLRVPSGRTILDVLRENGIDMPSSCEQGACGTCLATVLEGEPDHQDVYLNDAEKKAGTRIMTCVSRAKSPRLVLDI